MRTEKSAKPWNGESGLLCKFKRCPKKVSHVIVTHSIANGQPRTYSHRMCAEHMMEVVQRYGIKADVAVSLPTPNWLHPLANIKIGTEVVLTDDRGKKHETKTRSVAWRLTNGQWLVKVDGRTGGYSLDRIARRTQ